MRMIACVVLVSGCGGGGADPSCAEAINKAVEVMKTPGDARTFIEMCEQDKWSGEIRRCIANARNRKELAECRRKQVIDDPSIAGELGKSKVAITKLAVDELANNAFPRWALKSSDKACPDSLLEVAKAVGKGEHDLVDPWGTPYTMFCGESLPPGAKGLAVLSFGEDKKQGTPDDVKSWAPAPK
jgi:hypothetical protein